MFAGMAEKKNFRLFGIRFVAERQNAACFPIGLLTKDTVNLPYRSRLEGGGTQHCGCLALNKGRIGSGLSGQAKAVRGAQILFLEPGNDRLKAKIRRGRRYTRNRGIAVY